MNNKPWLPDPSDLIAAMELTAKRARLAGHEVIGQFFLMAPALMEDGSEVPACGRLRYTPERVLRDLQEIPEGREVTICFVVRHADPNTPDGAGDIARHERAREMEREALERGA